MNAAFQPPGRTPAGQTATDQLLDAMAQTGIVYDDSAPIAGDGKLHRFHVEGDAPGVRNGWYCFHDDATPAGNFGCNKRYGPDEKLPFSAKRAKPLTPQEKAELEAKMALQKAKREAEEKARHEAAAVQAKAIWEAASPATQDDHPYLLKKRYSGPRRADQSFLCAHAAGKRWLGKRAGVRQRPADPKAQRPARDRLTASDLPKRRQRAGP